MTDSHSGYLGNMSEWAQTCVFDWSKVLPAEENRDAKGTYSEGAMKNFNVSESCTGLDRLATWDEVRSAMASQGADEPDCTSNCGDVESQVAGGIDAFPEKLTWMALLSERLHPKSN